MSAFLKQTIKKFVVHKFFFSILLVFLFTIRAIAADVNLIQFFDRLEYSFLKNL